MTSIQRNFNGVIYKVTVKEEEQRRRMAEKEDKEGGEVTLEEPKVTEVDTEATGSAGCAMHRHEGTKPCSGPWRSLSSSLEAPSVEELTVETSSVEAPSVEAPSVKVVNLCFVVEGSPLVLRPQNIRRLEGVESGGEGWPGERCPASALARGRRWRWRGAAGGIMKMN